MSRRDTHNYQNAEDILNELISLLNRLDITVKYAQGSFQSGLVKYENCDLFYINRKAKAETNINAIVDELKNLDIPVTYLSEALKPLFHYKTEDTKN